MHRRGRQGRSARRVACVLVCVLAVLVSACGFHLRGGRVVPQDLSKVYVSASAIVSDELRIFLEEGGAEVVSRRADAEVILDVKQESFDSRVLTVDPDTGKSREFELSYLLRFDLRRADGSVLMKSQSINLVRDHVFDEDEVIGKSREQDVLRDEMRRDAAQQVLRRMQAALGG